MFETILNLIGISTDAFYLSDDVVFTVCSLLLLFCLGYVFNFFQSLMERCTK